MKSKNVLVLIPHLAVGGTEIQTLNLVRALTLGGHRVTTLCIYRCIPEMVKAFQEAGSKVICVSPEYDHYGIDIKFYNGVKLLKFLYHVLNGALKKEKYDVIHVQYMTPMATAIVMLKYIFGFENIIATSHTNADIYKSLSLVHFNQKFCCKVFTCITCKAEEEFFETSTLYSENYKIRNHCHFTIYNSLPYRMRFSNVKRLPLQANETITIGVVSRLEEIKGMDLVIPAMNDVCKVHKNFKLIVVGDGKLRTSMESQMSSDLTKRTMFVGRKEQVELCDWYGKMDIVLMPSRSEGFGLTAIEAMANGCVMVVSNTGGLPEVVKNGETGLLHAPESVSDLSDKIIQLLNDRILLNKMRGNVNEYVRRFSFEKYTSLINLLYSNI